MKPFTMLIGAVLAGLFVTGCCCSGNCNDAVPDSYQIKVKSAKKFITAPAINDNMIIQRDQPVRIFGEAAPGSTVTVEFAGQKVSAVADANGRWLAVLQPLAASKENRVMKITCGKEVKEIRNVLVGEVWYASGQSNMEMPMWGKNPKFRQKEGDKIAAEPTNGMIRMLPCIPIETKFAPVRNNETHPYSIKWMIPSEDNLQFLSATGFLFAKNLYEKLDVPVGIITAFCGGTGIELWTPPSGFKTVPELKKYADLTYSWIPGSPEYNKALKEYKESLQKCLAELEQYEDPANFNGERPFPTTPPAFPEAWTYKFWPPKTSQLYNGTAAHLVPYTIKGIIWYQGCNNIAQGGPYYVKAQQALLNGLRIEFRNPKLPFYYVQLAPYGKYGKDFLPYFWEGQQKFAEINDETVGMAVINDAGDLRDIHPGDKRPVADRLARLALARTYGFKDIVADSPVLDTATVKGDRYILKFKNVKKFVTNKRNPQFEVAGADGKYVKAECIVKDNEIEVFAKTVAKPEKLRFMWSNTAEASLFNEAGLPMGAFRVNDTSVPARIKPPKLD